MSEDREKGHEKLLYNQSMSDVSMPEDREREWALRNCCAITALVLTTCQKTERERALKNCCEITASVMSTCQKTE